MCKQQLKCRSEEDHLHPPNITTKAFTQERSELCSLSHQGSPLPAPCMGNGSQPPFLVFGNYFSLFMFFLFSFLFLCHCSGGRCWLWFVGFFSLAVVAAAMPQVADWINCNRVYPIRDGPPGTGGDEGKGEVVGEGCLVPSPFLPHTHTHRPFSNWDASADDLSSLLSRHPSLVETSHQRDIKYHVGQE